MPWCPMIDFSYVSSLCQLLWRLIILRQWCVLLWSVLVLNASFSTLELCERTQLLGPFYTGNNESMAIVEDTWVVSIKFELEANFSIRAVLEAASIGQSVSTTDVAIYLSVVKCSADSFESNMNVMVPNDRLSYVSGLCQLLWRLILLRQWCVLLWSVLVLILYCSTFHTHILLLGTNILV